MPRTYEAREHLPQGGPWPSLKDTYRVLTRAPTAEEARAAIDARLVIHPEERGHFTVALVETPEGVPLPPPGEGGFPGA